MSILREIFELQCGRIYKDAEISPLARGFIIAGLVLQCGRIYKDAEISASASAHSLGPSFRFNVAASIKMRKCTYPNDG